MYSFKFKMLKIIFSVGAAGSGFALSIHHLKEKPFSFTDAHAATYDSHLPPLRTWDCNWDKRDPIQLIDPKKLRQFQETNDASAILLDHIAERSPTATRHLLFIRHGQYHTKFKEDDKRSLTDLGREQAICTGLRLKELGDLGKFDYDLVTESSMTRAIETSALICDQLKNTTVKRTDLLREGSPIEPDPPFRHWRPELSVFTDGPRIEAAFRSLVYRADASQKHDSYEIVVCHANVIRYFVCRALQVPPEAWLRMSLRHGSLTWLSINPNGYVSVKCVGEAGHMSPKLLSVE